MPKTVKGAPLRFFKTSILLQKFKKIEGEKFLKKMRIFNRLIVPKNLKKGTLWDFLKLVLLQNIKKMKGGPFGDIKKFSKKSHKAEKKGVS